MIRAREVCILSHVPLPLLARVGGRVSKASLVAIPNDGELPDDVRGDVLLTMACGSPNLATIRGNLTQVELSDSLTLMGRRQLEPEDVGETTPNRVVEHLLVVGCGDHGEGLARSIEVLEHGIDHAFHFAKLVRVVAALRERIDLI